MFIATAEDWRIILVKLADRLDILRHLELRSREDQLAYATETLEVIAPLAHRLGIWEFKSELEELGFRYTYPEQYRHVKQLMREKEQEMTDALQAGGLAIKLKLLEDDPVLTHENVTLTVKGRIKGAYSVWNKMRYGEREFGSIKDLMALRVVLDVPRRAIESDSAYRMRSEAYCYHTMKVIRSMESLCCDDNTGKVKDFIAFPKANGYQSLHTIVHWKDQIMEVQVRTLSMHYVAEYGLAAHWIYKDQLKDLPKMPSYKVAWIYPLVGWKPQENHKENHKDGELYSPAEFVEVVRRELLGKRVLVFMKTNGKIINLPKGATILDAMDECYPTISAHLLRAEVNDQQVPFWYKLHTGDSLRIFLPKKDLKDDKPRAYPRPSRSISRWRALMGRS
jgi:GTP pyrophosphokinase